MKDFLIQEETLPNAYHNAIRRLYNQGLDVTCSDWNTNQKEISMTMYITDPLAEPMISKLFIGGPEDLEQYRQEIVDGILDFEVERGKWSYTYHQRMVEPINQIEKVIDILKKTPDSRRAVILIRRPEDIDMDDPPCLQHIQYFIRNGKLDCDVLFRSNDACKAAFMNSFALIMLQKYIADQLNIEVGTYTHRANSFHCYEKDFDTLKGYVNAIANAELRRDPGSLCYEYKGFWEDEMDEAKDKIKLKVENLKNNN